jgi:hypothetical protein
MGIFTMPRWLIIGASPYFIAFGIASFFIGWGEDSFMTTDTGKGVMLLVFGLITLWAGVTWSYIARILATKLAAVLLLLTGILGAALSSIDAPNLGFTNINAPWESVVYILFGIAYALAAWWKRPFDYHD